MTIELDYMEFVDDAAAQTAYPTDANYWITTSFTTESGNVSRAIGYGDDDQEKLAQGIKVSENITCDRVDVMIKKFNSPTDNIQLRIETDSAGDPSGTLAVAGTTSIVAASGIDTGYEWVTFTLGGDVALTAGTQYHIVLRRSGSMNTQHHILWRQHTTGIYADGVAKKLDASWGTDGSRDFLFKVYSNTKALQCYSESTLKEQGSYSLKGIGRTTDSLNDTLTRTIGTTIDLSNKDTIDFDIYASRTGSNITISIRDSGGTWTEKTPNITSANVWQNVEWDISAVSNANKDAIDRIKITIVNADTENTFYIDDMYVEGIYSVTDTDTVTISESTSSVGSFHVTDTDTVNIDDNISDILNRPLSLNYRYYLGSFDGKVYAEHADYKSDDGTTIETIWLSKQGDFADQYQICLNKFKTLYKIKLWYIDKQADTYVVIYVSTDGGSSWDVQSRFLGNGDGTNKSADFFFEPITGQTFQFKVINNTTTDDFQWTALTVYFTVCGDYFEI